MLGLSNLMFSFREDHPEILPGEVFLGNLFSSGFVNLPLRTVRRGDTAFGYGHKKILNPERRLFPVFVSEVEFLNVYRGDEPENCVVCAYLTTYHKSTPISQRAYYVEGIGQACEVCWGIFNSSQITGC